MICSCPIVACSAGLNKCQWPCLRTGETLLANNHFKFEHSSLGGQKINKSSGIGICHETLPEPCVRCLQANELMQQQQQDGPAGSRAAAGLIEALTQKLLALDNVPVDGDQEVRQKRKAEINRINQLLDRLESHRTKQ